MPAAHEAGGHHSTPREDSLPSPPHELGVCPGNFHVLASRNVPLRAPASPAQCSDCSPRRAGPQPHDVLRLALRRGEASEGGRSPPPSYLATQPSLRLLQIPPRVDPFGIQLDRARELLGRFP